jgi:hypothetical protein
LCLFRGRGSIKVISVSKIRKIIVKIKNRNEKELRFSWFGSKPHSKGENFSEEILVLFIIEEIKKKNKVNKKQKIKIFIIIVSVDFLIGS